MFEDIKYVYIIDTNGKIIYLSSPELGNKHNYKVLSDIIGYISKTGFADILKKIKNRKNLSFNILTDDVSDSTKDLFCLITPLYSSNGEINHASVIITDRKYKFLFNENNDALFITDLSGNYLEVNSVATSRSGITPDKFKKLSLFNIPSRRGSEIIKEYFTKIMEKGSATKQIDYTNSNHELVSTELIGKKIKYDGENAILHSSREISQQKKSNREILESIIQSDEQDRKYFASEILHNLGPLLSLNKMLIETYFDSDQSEIKSQIVEKIKTNLDEAIKITTELTQDISPQILTKFGLRPALHTFITKFAEQQKIKIRLTLDIPERFSEKVDMVLYRVIVEIVNYFVKYKCSAFVNIDFCLKKDFFQCILESNNKSVNPNIQPDSNYQLKQINLESRLNSINGEIEYQKKKTIDRIIIEGPLSKDFNIS